MFVRMIHELKQDMGHMSYNRVGRRCHGTRGFRLNPKRFSVQRLRARFLYLFRLLNTWRRSYGQVLQSLKRGISRRRSGKRNNSRTSSSRRRLAMEVPTDCRLRSFGRSNSFYSEAIADCLEFIKRSSISVDDKSVAQR